MNTRPNLSMLALAAALSLPAAAPASDRDAGAAVGRCTHDGRGQLRARLRGTLDLDIAWRDDDMHCDGGPRPDGKGLRVTIAGPLQSDGRRLRFVFGIDDVPEGRSVQSRPTNITVIFEGEQRIFATRGAGRCTTDRLDMARVGALGGSRRNWQISARGFCTAPALALTGPERLLISRFDFVTEVSFEDPDAGPAAADRRDAAGAGAAAPAGPAQR
ncbi:MAG: hypothetical protein R3E65_02105 [Steroidobacteraceae bacterium]